MKKLIKIFLSFFLCFSSLQSAKFFGIFFPFSTDEKGMVDCFHEKIEEINEERLNTVFEAFRKLLEEELKNRSIIYQKEHSFILNIEKGSFVELLNDFLFDHGQAFDILLKECLEFINNLEAKKYLNFDFENEDKHSLKKKNLPEMFLDFMKDDTVKGLFQKKIECFLGSLLSLAKRENKQRAVKFLRVLSSNLFK